MTSVIYVDNDDEITSAAARIRDTTDGGVALVLPHGSRISTSRINFRLLAREAQLRNRRLAIVAADNATRALAASAGLPVFASVAEFEQSVAPSDLPRSTEANAVAPVARTDPVARPDPVATTGRPARTPRLGSDVGAAQPTSDIVVVDPVAGATGVTVTPARSATTTTPVVAPGAQPVGTSTALVPAAPRRRWRLAPRSRSTLAAVIGALLLLALLVVAVVGWLVLPAATITVTPREEAMSPASLSITADPALTTPDPVAGAVPARVLTFDLAAGDTFTVKGRRVEEAKATGRVTFGSKDPTRENRIGAGSIVSTQGGIQFRTTASIVIPKATFVGLTVIPGQASVGIEAVQSGPEGNVDPNTITVVPGGEDPVLTYVRNRNPTTGGSRQEFPRIDQTDIDAAIAALNTQLDDDFDTLIRDQGRLPAGFIAFDETRQLGNVVPTTDPATLLGKEVDTFELEAKTTASLTAVDRAVVTSVVADRLRASVASDHRLVDGSVNVEVGRASLDGTRITFPVTATASQVRLVDAATVVQQVKGKPVAEARDSLRSYGDVNVTVWPDWVTTVPTLDGRIDVRVQPATAPSPRASVTP
jgi:hypothetical protein